MSTPERVVDLSSVPHELLRDTSARFTDDTDTRRKSLTVPMLSSNTNASGSEYNSLQMIMDLLSFKTFFVMCAGSLFC